MLTGEGQSQNYRENGYSQCNLGKKRFWINSSVSLVPSWTGTPLSLRKGWESGLCWSAGIPCFLAVAKSGRETVESPLKTLAWGRGVWCLDQLMYIFPTWPDTSLLADLSGEHSGRCPQTSSWAAWGLWLLTTGTQGPRILCWAHCSAPSIAWACFVHTCLGSALLPHLLFIRWK